MNFADEDYVRYYTRETVSWRALGWEGQTVLALMLHGKFDRSGVFECDGHTPSHAVTLVTGLPAEVVEVGLKRLLEAGTWVHNDGRLVWPNYIEGQTCRRTDRARQEESRRNRRDSSLGDNGDDSHTRIRTVTRGHTASPPVTPNLTKPNRTKPNQDHLGGDSEAGPKQPDPVREVFEFWQADTGHKAAKLTDEKRKHIGARLKDFTVEQLKQVVRNRRLSPHYMGQNETKTVYDGIDNLFRNTDRVEKLLALGAKAKPVSPAPDPKVAAESARARAEFAERRRQELAEEAAKLTQGNGATGAPAPADVLALTGSLFRG